MTPAWFRYERSLGRWCPTVHHTEKPRTPKGEEDRVTTAWPVPEDCLSADGSPMFGRLKERFPEPVVRVVAR